MSRRLERDDPPRPPVNRRSELRNKARDFVDYNTTRGLLRQRCQNGAVMLSVSTSIGKNFSHCYTHLRRLHGTVDAVFEFHPNLAFFIRVSQIAWYDFRASSLTLVP